MDSSNKSEIARLRQQIADEYLAAQRGLSGLASGTAQHAFIHARMEGMRTCHNTLKDLVGAQEAIKIVAETLEAL